MTDNQSSAGKGMGITALVLGILGVICSFIPCFGFFAIMFGALAIIFGAIGLSQAKKGGGSLGTPRAGLILGILSTVFTIIWWITVASAIAASATELNEAMNEINDAFEESAIELENDLEESATELENAMEEAFQSESVQNAIKELNELNDAIEELE